MGKTIIVSNRLPVKIEMNEGQTTFTPSAGGLATGLGSIYKEGQNIWIGWPGMYLDDPEMRAEIMMGLNEEKMAPVFLTQEEIEDYYEGFSNETLWPAFHYFTQYITYNNKFWEAYKKVNEKFCEAILKRAQPDDTIWVHDYQLLLLPQMLREKLPNAAIAFFQHIPFPSYEVMRMIPWRKELLTGMIGADLIGFHTYDDMRHFLSGVGRIVGLPSESGYIQADNRIINVDSFPMGIDYDKYSESAKSPATLDHIESFKQSLGDQKLVLTIDRLDYSKGIPQRIIAFEEFLERYPEYHEGASLIMIVVPSRDNVPEYKKLKEEVDELVGRVNGHFGTLNWTPIHYFYRSFPLEELSAFYRMSDIALITPLRDGMNLVCKEFVASKIDQKGVLILSEMAGASKELSDAILVNPNDSEEMVNALYRAFTMPEEEQIHHNQIMQRSLKRYDVFQWVKVFMDRLDKVKEKQADLTSKAIDDRLIEKIKSQYDVAGSRVLFLDYDGTLVGFHNDPQKAAPNAELIDLLNVLKRDENNRIIIISGRDRDTLESWLGEIEVEMVAEHGVWMKSPGEDWELAADFDASWKDEIREIMEYYVQRTPGAFIEEKHHSLVWHYRKVESGLGDLRMRELFSHLKYMARGQNLQVLEGNKVLEIKRPDINKGRAAMRLLRDKKYDFSLAIGDDWTDEDTFKVMPDEAISIRVGYTYTNANYNIKSYEEVRELLKLLGSSS
ncbi:MAG: bifunctional alpha,alpha-trehalose-phosphate synthase (UDP-forming)/trehalose-phosphatase [Cyclobacteriaceae bacterium]|nr:bifunctional alpha,alpha-trehalose-phosphate synthase (UDP-forming)/trehalose-phosphatase [Cyclobacteriaceae bacterium]MCH8516245.1 bifunctional alpha,alpha-trehalose-phosphate synthase (UDP-forming)/trehalose-phosphatase [Cyclobacteriaceae bacterium]